MASNRNAPNRGRPPSTPRTAPKFGEIRLSTISKSDLPRVMEIEGLCYPNPWSFESFKQMLDDVGSFSTMSARSSLAGLVGYIVYAEVVDELHILNVAIDPRFQRQGIATLMLMHLHQKAISHDRKKSFLEVRETNAPAQQLYKKFGYKTLSRRKDYYTDSNEDAIVMVADLNK